MNEKLLKMKNYSIWLTSAHMPVNIHIHVDRKNSFKKHWEKALQLITQEK